jgi:hypothetical protein
MKGQREEILPYVIAIVSLERTFLDFTFNYVYFLLKLYD